MRRRLTSRDAQVMLAFAFGLLILLRVLVFRTGWAWNAGDLWDHYEPLNRYAVERIQSGGMPLWNPFMFSGAPFLGTAQPAVFSPAHLLFQTARLSTAFGAVFLIQPFLAGLGAFLWACALGARRSGALAAAAVYAGSGMIILRIPHGHPVIQGGYAWLPWLALALSTRSGVLLGAVTALIFTSGHAQPMGYAALMGLAWLSFVGAGHAPARLLRLATATILGLALAAPALLPVIEMAVRSVRGASDPLVAMSYSWPPAYLAALVRPLHFGNPIVGTFHVPDHPSYFFEFCSVYMGLAGLALAFFGVVRVIVPRRGERPAVAGAPRSPAVRPVVMALVLGAVLAAALAFGEHTFIYPALLKLLPPLGMLRAPARFFVLLALVVSVLAARGIAGLRIRGLGTACLLVIAVEASVTWRDVLVPGNPAPALSPSVNLAWLSATGSRVLVLDDIAHPNKPMRTRIPHAGGYDAMMLFDYAAYLAAADGGPAVTTVGLRIQNPGSSGIGALGVKWIATARDLRHPLLRLARQDGGFRIYEHLGARPRLRGVASARITRDDPERVAFEAEGPGRLLLADPWYPGWVAVVNGRVQPVWRDSGLFRAVDLPGGHVTGEFVYRPVSFLWGMLAALGALIVSLVGAASWPPILRTSHVGD